MLSNPRSESNLQTMPLSKVCLWLKKEAILQKNGGPTEIILHFVLRFPCFLGFVPSQAVALQRPAPIQPLPKKSCLKTDGRFSLPSGICHNHRVKVETTGWDEGCEGWTVIKCPPPLRAQRFGARNESSAFGPRAGKRRWRAHTPEPAGLSGAHHTRYPCHPGHRWYVPKCRQRPKNHTKSD